MQYILLGFYYYKQEKQLEITAQQPDFNVREFVDRMTREWREMPRGEKQIWIDEINRQRAE